MFYFLLLTILFRFNSSSTPITRATDFAIFILFLMVFVFKKVKFNNNVVLYALLICVAMYASLLKGALIGSDNPRNYFELFRPVYYFLIFSVLFHYMNNIVFLGSDLARKKVAFVFSFYLIVQSLLMIYQKINPSGFLSQVIDIFYGTDKISEGLGRVVGLSGNPNTLAICLSLVMFYFVSNALCEKRNLRAVLLIFVNLFLVFLSTSRTVLLVILVIYSVIFIFKLPWSIKVLVFLFGFSLSYQAYEVIMANPYYHELIVNLANFDLYNIPSIYNRVEHYKFILDQVSDSPVLSYGPNKSLLSVGDNIYLFIYFQWGIVGLLLQALPVVGIFFIALYSRGEVAYRVALSTLLILITGLAYETFYNLIYMPIYLFYLCEFKMFLYKSKHKVIDQSLQCNT